MQCLTFGLHVMLDFHRISSTISSVEVYGVLFCIILYRLLGISGHILQVCVFPLVNLHEKIFELEDKRNALLDEMERNKKSSPAEERERLLRQV